MPRKRKGKKPAPTPGPSTHSVAKKKKDKKLEKIAQTAVFSDDQYGLDLLTGFMHSDEDVIAIAYRVNTGHLAKGDIVAKYKSKMITALMEVGRRRGLTVYLNHVQFRALPLGEDTVIKASTLLRNASKKDGTPGKTGRKDDPFGWAKNENQARRL